MALLHGRSPRADWIVAAQKTAFPQKRLETCGAGALHKAHAAHARVPCLHATCPPAQYRLHTAASLTSDLARKPSPAPTAERGAHSETKAYRPGAHVGCSTTPREVILACALLPAR